MNRTALAVTAVVAIGLAACSSDPDQVSLETSIDELDVIESTSATTMSPLADSATEQTEQSTPDSVKSESGVVPEGFSTVTVEITKADGEVCEVCMWLADSAAERGQGLMGVTSLGTPGGMAFVWEQPTSGGFFMFQTVTSLSIAWFDAGGALVSTADMEPCLSEDSSDCERFPASRDYVLAIEVFEGDLASIGITDGATARLLPGTEATVCPLN